MSCHSVLASAARFSISASHQEPVCSSTTGAPNSAAASICAGAAPMNSETRMPACLSACTTGASCVRCLMASSPPSVVRSVRFSGTRQTACGCTLSAIAVISSVAAISKLSGLSISAFRRAMSSSRMWRRSSRKCAVMPSQPAAIASLAARTGSGWRPPRALRMVATWSTLMPRRKRGGLIYLTVDPFRLRHHRFGAQLRDDVGEMLEVVDLQIDQHIGEVRRPPRHADIVDIAVVLGDHLCDLCERAGLVHRLHRDARRETARRTGFLVPAYVQPAFRLVLELTQGVRLDRVDGCLLYTSPSPRDGLLSRMPS